MLGPGLTPVATFTAIDDTIVERMEEFTVSFITSDPAVLQPIPSSTFTITDDNLDCKAWTHNNYLISDLD